ncbi:MAG: sugar transferase, partial [Bacteroidota bacterium]|nr:sugar transferase [Bacteroidota bacterium]
QVRGRNQMTWQRQFALDRDYVRNRGFLLDLRILIRTPLALLRTREAARFRDEYNPKTRRYES